jgi:hypothetical protein
MVEPIRKPVHRPRPPHPHTQSRPRAVLVRSRLLAKELDTTHPLPEETPPPVSLTLLPPPNLRTAPPRTAPLPPPPLESRPDPLPVDVPSRRGQAALAPPEDLPLSSVSEQVTRERSARGLLLTALALHAGALLVAFPGASADLGTAELLLAGCVLLSGGMMLVLGRR